MLLSQNSTHCIDTKSSSLSETFSGKDILALWQQALVMTSAWFLASVGQTYHNFSKQHQRYRQRKALEQLDHRLLDDIGVSKSAALREINKPFWRD